MAESPPAPAPRVEDVASRRARSTLVTAYLLTGEWAAAEEAAARALVAGRRAAPVGDEAGDDAAAVVRALARRRVQARGPWWSRDGGLHLQELGALPTASVDDPRRLWAGLSQLTEEERAAVVLRGRHGMDTAAIAAALGRRPADVTRDLETADGIVAQAADAPGDEQRDVAAELSAFFAAHGELPRPIVAVEQRADVLERRAHRTRRALVAVGVVTALAVAGLGTATLRSSGDPAGSGDNARAFGPPGWVLQPRSNVLPSAGPGRKLVGFQSVVVSVPASWLQVTASCHAVRGNAVVFPVSAHGALCGDDDVRAGLSVVSFNRDIAGEPEVEGEFGPRRAHGGEFIVAAPTEPGGRFVAYTSAPDLGFGMSVTTASRRTLNQIIASIAVLPAGYTTVPDVVGRPSDQAERIVAAHHLVADQRFRPGFVPVPMEVARQSTQVGTVLAAGGHIAVQLVAR